MSDFEFRWLTIGWTLSLALSALGLATTPSTNGNLIPDTITERRFLYGIPTTEGARTGVATPPHVATISPIERTTSTPVASPTEPTKEPESESTVGVKSRKKCEEYGKFVYQEIWDPVQEEAVNQSTCAATEPLIVGGSDANPREFPHQVMIAWTFGSLFSYPQWYCGGSLISEWYVLTAAHCEYMDHSKPTTKGRWVRLGDYNIGITADEKNGLSQIDTIEVEKFIHHPEYKRIHTNDIGLIKLKYRATLSEYIRPACLHTEYKIPKKYGIATGWGKLEYNSSSNAAELNKPLQKVNLTFTAGDTCVYYFGKQSKNNDSTMLCAGGQANPGKDTCQGDSGGPLQYRLASPHCIYSIVGITSYGHKCSVGYPGVFTRVSHFVGWIEKIVWPETS